MEVASPRDLAALLKPGMPANPALAWHPALTGPEQYGGAMEPAQKPDVAGLVQALGSARDAMGGSIADRMAHHGAQQQARMASGNFSPTPVTADSMDLADSVAGGLVGNIGMAAAIKAYHGSPHRFDRFDMSKIGTGEGAQAYGHGLYMAESPDVARQYKKDLTGMRVSSAQRAVDEAGGDIEAALAAAQKKIDHYQSMVDKGGVDSAKAGRFLNLAQERMDELSAYKQSGQFSQGALYTTRLDVEPEDLLDWDAPLSEQSEKVRAALGKWGIAAPDAEAQKFVDKAAAQIADLQEQAADSGNARDIYRKIERLRAQMAAWGGGTGREAYQEIVRREGRGPEGATQALRSAGVPGIRYLDQGSRDAGAGTRNFVLFDDSLIEIEGIE